MGLDEFTETLLSDTAGALRRAAGNEEEIRGIVFLFLNRAYEHGLTPDRMCDLLGVSKDNVLNRAKLSKQDEAAVMDSYESLDRILEQTYAGHVHERPSSGNSE